MPWSLQNANNRFSQVVDAAVGGDPQVVTRHGKAVVVIIAAFEYERLAGFDRGTAPSFSQLLLALPQDDEAFERSALVPPRHRSGMFLIDTDVLSELRKRSRNPRVVVWMEATRSTDLFLSVITIGEIERGIDRQAGKDPRFSAALAAWLDRLLVLYTDRILSIDLRIARHWGRLSATAGHNGADLMFAATALEHGLTVVSRNTRHFRAGQRPDLEPVRLTRRPHWDGLTSVGKTKLSWECALSGCGSSAVASVRIGGN